MGYFAAKIPAATMHIGDRQHVPWATAPKSPKVLIAVPCCHGYDYGEYKDKRIGHVDRDTNERVRGIRDTWHKQVSAFKSYVDMRFFYGNPAKGKATGVSQTDDEIILDCGDDYISLPAKVQRIYLWAIDHGYDYVFKTDDDTYVYLDRLMSSGFERQDYIGYCYPSHGNYITGGAGYWVSKKVMRLLVDAKVDDWAEDKWVGAVLKTHGIQPVRDARYLPGFNGHYVRIEQLPDPHNYISFHACTPEMMRQLDSAMPSPTFKLQMQAMGEEAYPNAASFPLNLRSIETVTNAAHGARPDTDGSASDPRRPMLVKV